MADLEMVKLFATLLALILTLLQLKYDGANKNMFQEHPIMAVVMVISLIIYWFLFWIKLKYPGQYLDSSVPFVVSFFGSLSMATTVSLLLPGYVTPFLFVVCLVLQVAKALYWVFAKLDEHLGETEFWMRRVDPALCYLRRRMKRNILPL